MGRIVIVEILNAQDTVRQRVRLDRWPAIIGRAYSAEVLLDDPYVSPEHVRVIDGDGTGLVIEDLASLNGLYTDDGRRVARTTLAPGAVVRVGHTRLRFCSAAQSVAPALADTARPDGHDAPARTGDAISTAGPRVGWRRVPGAVGLAAICVAATAVVCVQAYFNSYGRSGGSAALEAGAGVFLALLVWAGPWALACRVVTHRSHMLAHVAIASAATIGLLAVGDAEQWFSYLYPGAGFAGGISAVASIAVFVGLLSGHLALASAMPATRRRRIVGTVTAAVVALLLLVAHADSAKFTNKMDYPATLRPLPLTWLPTTSVSGFIAATNDLKTRADSLASER